MEVKGRERRPVAQAIATANQDAAFAFHPGMGLEEAFFVFGDADVDLGVVTAPRQKNLDGQGLSQTRRLGHPLAGAFDGPHQLTQLFKRWRFH